MVGNKKPSWREISENESLNMNQNDSKENLKQSYDGKGAKRDF